MVRAVFQPTMRRENTSITNATYTIPDHVEQYLAIYIYCAEDGQSQPRVPDDRTVVTCDDIAAPHQTDVCRATTTLMTSSTTESFARGRETRVATSSFRT